MINPKQLDELTDWRGTPIRVGSLIVYAVTHSSSISLVEAEVLAIGERESWGKTLPTLDVKRLREAFYSAAKPVTSKTLVTLTSVQRVTVIV